MGRAKIEGRRLERRGLRKAEENSLTVARVIFVYDFGCCLDEHRFVLVIYKYSRGAGLCVS